MKLVTGPTEIRLDNAWKEALGARRRATVTMLTAPHLIGYGYGLGKAKT